MFKINNKSLIAAAVLAAAGIVVAAADMAQSRPTTNANAIVEARFPSAGEAWTVVALPTVEAPKKQVPATCAREHWPQVSDECLAGQGKRPVRNIPIQRRIATTQSVSL